jgi:hypothetical protein
MRIKGFSVLVNDKEWIAWAKRKYLHPCEKPTEYPCIADERIGSDENGYPTYEYESFVKTKLDVLLIAKQKINENRKIKFPFSQKL